MKREYDLTKLKWRRTERPAARSRLGADGELLQLPQAALEASPYDERDRVALCGSKIKTTAAKRYKKVENATAVIWKVLIVVEKGFRRLDAPELLSDVLAGVTYLDGVRIRNAEGRASA